MAADNGMTAAQAQQALRIQNNNVRNYITSQCPQDTQQIFAQTVAAGGAASGLVVNVLPKNVGLITGFLARVDVDIVTPAGVTLARTPYGPSNLLGKIEFIDLANYTRISTQGWHLAAINSVRARGPAGAAYTTDTPLGFGNVMTNGIVCPATVAASTTQRVSMTYHVPLAYSNDDLRGAIYAGVVSATMALNLSVNAAAVVAVGANQTLAVYAQTGAGTVLVQNAKITVYQIFYDQLPISNGGPVLPFDDLTTSYQLKQTNLVGLSVGQDFPIPYANFNEFYSTCVLFDNGGTLNNGSDINNFQLITANASQLWKYEPWVLSYKTRTNLSVDMPIGQYYFESRRRPISTLQYGNQQLMLNPSVVNANAQLYVGFEYMTKQGTVNASGSLPAG